MERLHFATVNLNGLRSKCDDLLNCLFAFDVDVCAIQESKLCPKTASEDVALTGFRFGAPRPHLWRLGCASAELSPCAEVLSVA